MWLALWSPELEVHGFNFRKSTDDEVKVEEDKVKSKTICW
jgi:hypothetical protein